MTIPISKLISVNDLYQKLGRTPPFEQNAYDTLKRFGDEFERGYAPGIPPEKVAQLPRAMAQIRSQCWDAITSVFIEFQHVALHDMSRQRQGQLAFNAGIEMIRQSYMVATLSVMKELGIEQTETNITEVAEEMKSRENDPAFASLRAQLKRDLR